MPHRPMLLALRRRAVMLGALVLVGALAIGLVSATPAEAHADLLDASPAPGAVLLEPPPTLEILFTEPVDPDLAFVDLLDPARRPLDGLGPIVVGDEGRSLRVDLPDLGPGVYTVSYQVVSTVDGHATTGSFAFAIDPTGGEAPPAAAADARAPAVDARAISVRWVGLIGALVALGSLLLWWRSRGLLARVASGPPWGFVAVAAGLAYAGTAAYLWLASRPIVEAVPERAAGLPLDFAAPFGWTEFAMAMRVALASSLTLAIVAGAAWAAQGRIGHRVAAVVGTALAATTLAGLSMAGHAAAAGGVASGIVDWLHMVAVAAWLGGLPAVLVLARRRFPGADARTAAGAMLRRHGPVALAAAPIVALTGVTNSPLVLGSARDLVASEYGNLLLAKGGLLSVALAIGAVNHFVLRGRGRAQVLALVGAELVVAALAVSVAATMVTIQPASARQPTLVSVPVAPAHLFGEAGEVRVHATVDLPTPGSQRFLVTVADRGSGAPREDVQLVFLELTPPADANLPTDRVDLEADPTRSGLYTAQGAHLSLEGDWGLEVVVRRAGVLDERVGFVVPVRAPAPPQLMPPADTGVGVPTPLAIVWSVLPPGPLGWAPFAVALVALVGTGALTSRGRRAGASLDIARVVLVAVVLLAGMGAGSRVLVAAANAPSASDLAAHAPDPAFVASSEEGEAIYRANCAACHGVDGDGRGPVRTLPAAGSLADAVPRMSSAELSYRIANGLAGTPMPAFATALTDAERWHLVRYLEERWTRP